MGSRSSHLRAKVVALLVSLAALWVFAAWVTLRDGLNLLWVQTYNTHIAQPMDPLLLELQRERQQSVVYLANRNSQRHQELESTRDRVRTLAKEFSDKATSLRARMASGSELEQRIDELIGGLDELARTRQAVDDGDIDRASTVQAYSTVLDTLFLVYDSLGQLDQPEIAKDTANLIELNRGRELLAQENALISGVIAAGRMSPEEYTRFVHLVGARRHTLETTVVRLPDADRARYQQMASGAAFKQLLAVEDALLQNSRPGGNLLVDAATWQSSVDPVLADLREVVIAGGDDVVDRAAPFAAGVIIRMVLAAGLGLVTVIASIVVSVTTARELLGQLERLRDAAWRLANDRLPDVVERLGRGEKVDVAVEAPPLEFGNDEIGQVGQAFNAVQETAIRTAVEQAELRRAVRDIFLSLARRTQALLHRQLTLLDQMERRETDPDDLEALFRVDHLATRMRRNAENLIVLSGANAGRTWRRSVPMIDVIRGAVAEVEDYTRVTVLPVGPEGLVGRAVGDVIHLLAELIENALSFSPPHTPVHVRGEMVANGYVIEIEDRGLGMTEEDRAAANERIASHPEFRLTDGAAQLGLYVVSRLTERHGVRVQLKESPYGGITAVVLIPLNLVTKEAGDSDPASPLATRPAVAAAIAAGQPGEARAATGTLTQVSARPTGQRANEPDWNSPTVAVPQQRRPEPDPAAATEATTGATAAETTASGTAASKADAAQTATAEADAPAGTTAPEAGPAASSVASPSAVAATAATQPGTTATQPSATAAAPSPTAPATASPAAPTSAPVTTYTPSGLPVRVRQAPAARAARRNAATPEKAHAGTDSPRAPEQIRRMVSSYQSGSRRGRSDAARLMAAEAGAPAGPNVHDQPGGSRNGAAAPPDDAKSPPGNSTSSPDSSD